MEVSPNGRFHARATKPDDFPIIERLFGPRGACGGCWCMTWRVPSLGQYWTENKGERNRQTFKALIESGQAGGCLAFEGDEPAGWCSIGPKGDFDYIRRARLLPKNDPESSWALTCFFIPTQWQRRGVSGLLIEVACQSARSNGARWLEAYPSVPKSEGLIPPAFAHTGFPGPFLRNGFAIFAEAGARLAMRKQLNPFFSTAGPNEVAGS